MSAGDPGASMEQERANWPPPTPRPLTSNDDEDQQTIERGRRSLWPIKLAMVAALAGAIYLALTAGRGDEPTGSVSPASEQETVETTAPTAVTAETTSSDEGPESTVVASETTATAAPDASTPTLPATSSTDDSTASTPIRGVLTNAQVSLEGEVGSEEAAASLVSLLESVGGAGNVTSALVVEPSAPPAERMSLAVADEIVFPVGSATIATEFLPVLDQVVDFMNLDPNITVIVEGHTDSQGNQVRNLALSQQRAEAVVDYIADQGINRFRLEPRGRGATEPLADEATPDGRRQNRRIEFEIDGFRLDLGS